MLDHLDETVRKNPKYENRSDLVREILWVWAQRNRDLTNFKIKKKRR